MKAVAVLSGGQDSATAMMWGSRIARLEIVEALTFSYGQRHATEIAAAARIAHRWKIPHRVIELPILEAYAASALTDHEVPVEAGHGYLGLPSTFTPGRNLLFLSQAAVAAFKLGAHHILTGVCETDFSGYPDCRRTFVDALEDVIARAMEWPLKIHTPLMHISKAATVRLAAEIEGVELPTIALTVTCYNGVAPGCGQCPACELRRKGFIEAGIPDPHERILG